MRIPVVSVLALISMVGGASAQQLAPVSFTPFDPSDATFAASDQKDTTHCFSCHPYPRPVRALGELLLVQLIPWSINAVVRDKQWAHVNFQTWEDNLENPWQWDNDHFIANQFGHPYHGSLYFNTARTNGYSFWGAVPWAYGGSIMWEELGEQFAPSANDLLNTGTGGITLGESLYRLSHLVLDNRARGSERVWREIAGAFINPVQEFNRLLDGEVSRVGPNPPEWRPPNGVQGVLDVGYRRITGSTSLGASTAANQGIAGFRMSYGDLVQDIKRSPFSHLEFNGELSTQAANGEGGKLSLITARGTLGGIALSDGKRAKHTLGALLVYEYYNNPAYEYGGQSVYGGLISEFHRDNDKSIRATTELLMQGIIIGATRSDHYYAGEGRNYDYGVGVGTRLMATFIKPGRALARFGWSGRWLHTMNGAPGSHFQGGGVGELRYFVTPKFGLGTSYQIYHRKSNYDAYPEVTQTSPFWNLFASAAMPRLVR